MSGEIPEGPFSEMDAMPPRVCENCPDDVELVLDFSRPRYEFRCPKCGRFEEFFGKRKQSIQQSES
jgi:predicted RNA-binding Zn-ribbon protein involved in translation (DUF1610 family)